MKTITMTLFDRIDYIKAVLSALKLNEGVEDYTLKLFIEPVSEDVLRYIKTISFVKTEIKVNDAILGASENTRQAILQGFKTSDFIIHIEEDSVPAQDTLRLMEWCNTQYRENPQIFSISGFNRSAPTNENLYHVYRQSWFTPWIMGLWRSKAEKVISNLQVKDSSYDVRLKDYVQANGLFEILPIYSRTHNIGMTGSNINDLYWQFKVQNTPYWAADLPSGPYREI